MSVLLHVGSEEVPPKLLWQSQLFYRYKLSVMPLQCFFSIIGRYFCPSCAS